MASSFSNLDIVVSPNHPDYDNLSNNRTTIAEALAYIRAQGSPVTQTATIRLLPGVYLMDEKIDATSLSNVRIRGSGKRVTTIRASAALLTALDASGTDAGSALIDMSGCSECSVEDLTVDALTNDTGVLNNVRVAGVYVQDCVEVSFVNCDIRGVTYGLWENTTNSGKSIDVFNCTIRSAGAAMRAGAAIWHVFASDIEGHFV